MITGQEETNARIRLSIGRLLAPKSVAIVGASPDPGTLGGAVLANFERFRYSGELHLVSRRHERIGGRECVASIDELPEGLDAVALVIGEAAVNDALIQCVRRRTNAVIVFAAGFAEVGGNGVARQERLSAIARESGLALVGPNCIGITNHVARVPLTFEPIDPVALEEPAGVAILAQSGGVVSHLRPALQARGVPVAYAVSTGNEAVLGVEDYLSVLVDDEHVSLVIVFAEQIRSPASFLASVQLASARSKAVVVMHPGRSQPAREAARSHTGALAGDHLLVEAVLKANGAVVVETLDELVDVAAVLVRFPAPPPGGVAIVTNSGALRGIALDFCEGAGLPVAKLDPNTTAAIRAMLPTYAAADNPVDVTTAGAIDPDVFARIGRAVLEDRTTSSVLFAVLGGGAEAQRRKAEALCKIPVAGKPIAVTILGDEAPLDACAAASLRARRLPVFRSADRAMRALARVADYADVRAAMRHSSKRPVVPTGALPGRGVLPEYAGKTLLASIGLPVPDGALAKDVAGAVAIASRIGYPVALKAQARALAHKSDAGGVALDVRSEEAVHEAWSRIERAVHQANPDLSLDGMLVETMARPGLEMLVGARRDPDWGPVLLFGVGGIWAEALNDVRIVAPTADRETIQRELRKLRLAKLLGGFRGAPAVDQAALVETIERLGALMLAVPEIAEVDINPLVTYPAGQGVLVLDALVIARDEQHA